MHLLTIVGARPQFIKAAMLSKAASRRPRLKENILHTGQHYDAAMSQVFFDQMAIPRPSKNLNVGSGSHGAATGAMLAGIEEYILETKPDMVLVHGDTNSTLAGALAAAKLHVPVAHVEAGLRSFNRRMPEEVNRVLTDHISDLLFCPTQAAVDNLAKEGVTHGVHVTGDVMYDAALFFGEQARTSSSILQDLGLEENRYFLATVHRAENTDDPKRLAGILQGLGDLAQEASMPLVLPLHPRTKKQIGLFGLEDLASRLAMIDPVSFLDMVRLESTARAICTDSGGVQKEGFFHGVPVVTLRDETEWIETVASGWNTLVGANSQHIVEAGLQAAPGKSMDAYGQGNAAQVMVDLLLAWNEKSTPGHGEEA
ncbi:MAG: UDP-N-acetylglucosamine 2-epimerase (non-hydrolyzing) [Desulfovibrio sp.]|nr:MAG: UDP-N-acetylglucosamine 2-epimerase (non-hydrolyzing) [Desulfovibrio sp.]